MRRHLGRSRNGFPALRSSVGSGCFSYRVDHVRVKDARGGSSVWERWPLNMVTPDNIMAVEIYRHPGEIPPELRQDANNENCFGGLIVIWTNVSW